MTEKATLEKYGRCFSDKNITVKNMLCLALFVSGDLDATEQIDEIVDDLEAEECLSLFAFPSSYPYIEDDDREDWAETILEYRHGWLILAYVRRPMNISFDENGRAISWSLRGISHQVLVYAETLEDALEKVSVGADEILEKVFNEAREEQGLPKRSGTTQWSE